MSDTQQQLEAQLASYRDKNFGTDWSMEDFRNSHLLSEKVDDEFHAIVAEIRSKGKPLYMLPVNSWYRQIPFMPMREKELFRKTFDERLSPISEKTGIQVYSGVTKVNYTNNTASLLAAPSFFVGDIPDNATFLIADDTIESGRTLRDMARFILNSGGNVAGILWLEDGFNYGKVGHISLYKPKEIHALLYGNMEGIGTYGEAKKAYKELSEQEKEAFLKKCAAQTSALLSEFALSFPQLTERELRNATSFDFHNSFNNVLQDSTELEKLDDIAENFEKNISDWKKAKVPDVAEIENPDELLRLIYDSKNRQESLTKSYGRTR